MPRVREPCQGESGSGSPGGGLWPRTDQSPLSAFGTGREMSEELLNDLEVFDDGDDPHGATSAGTQEGINLVDFADID